MEKQVEVSLFKVRLYCDRCEEEMELTNQSLRDIETFNDIEVFDYICPKCGYKIQLTDYYPKLIVKDK